MKAREALREVLGVAVVVTKQLHQLFKFAVVLYAGIFTFGSPIAAVLPEDRADALYHYYEGGGVEIAGPSILMRKTIANKVSISANYYIDNVSSASIDVVTTASEYTEKRIEKSVGIDYLNDKTTIGLNYTASDENDFAARSAHLSISQDFFGDLTTLSMGYSQGWDEVGKRGEIDFKQDTDRRHFKVGISQVITKDSILNLAWETITDQGYLNNPYRSVRYLDPTSGAGYSYQSEVYPSTRTSDSIALRGMYYLPYRASIKLDLKQFSDTWGIKAKTAEIGYIHPINDSWMVDAKVRHYSQTKADFFSDLFSRIDAQNFLARDKEMSSFNSTSFGIGGSYKQLLKNSDTFDRYSINLSYDYMQFEYEDFKDLRVVTTPGDEPLYRFNANVIRLYFSIFY